MRYSVKDITFLPPVREIMSLVDEVFEELGQPPTIENPHFKLVHEWSWEGKDCSGISFISNASDERVRVYLNFSCFEFRLDLDRANEFPVWVDHEYIHENREALKKKLLMIFGRPIILMHKGNRTCFRIYEPDGEVFASWKYYEGFSFSFLYRKSIIWHLKPFFEVG